MKAEEMMLGDWVSFNGEPVKVVHIVSGINEYDYDAIPITVEILEKNGFKHRIIDCAEFYYIAEDYYDITISEWSDSIWLVRFDCTEMNTPHEQKICGYVHQLQHFLKECGLTELADNFKV